MTMPALSGTTSFKRVARGLVALHRLMREGKDDSPEAESIRDGLDAPLRVLNPTEKNRSQWLSEDLYSVGEPPAPPEQYVLNPQAQRQLKEAIEARDAGEWDRALALLRPLKDSIAPALLSFLRGAIWLEAGYPEVAAVFYEHAAESDPTNAKYQVAYMHALAQSAED